nr:AAA family ATPase [Microbacterium ulmi]
MHRLELEGFGPFRERQTVDFDAFDADGLFLISGRTGAGKSSILDGVCFSLYGTAPRYDGGDRGLRSHHAAPNEPTVARLEFSTAQRRWRVTRTPEHERPRARGAGTTTAKATVLIEEFVAGEWVPRAARHREAADLLDEVVGLNRDQFQQVILLAQNRFSEFLLAKNENRQALLRTLFGSRRYEEYEQGFELRRREAQHAVEASAATLQALLAHAETIVTDNDLAAGSASAEDAAVSGAERLAAIERAVPRARYRADESARRAAESEAAHDAALSAFGARSALHEKQRERLASRATLAALVERDPAVADDRVRLTRARAAEALRAPVESAARARIAAASAADVEREAREVWTSAGEPDAAPAQLRTIVDRIAGDLALWARAAELERSLPALESARDGAAQRAASLEGAISALADAASARAARVGVLDPELAAAEAAAPPVGPANAARDSAAQRLAAGREAARLAPLAHAADSAHLAAAADRDRASSVVRTLLQRRLDGYAGELAGVLTDGEPCAVCGSIEHPHPAAPADEPVTDEAISAAEAAVKAADRAVADASERAREARSAHQTAAARAGGVELEQLETLHAEAEARARAAVEAADAISRLKRELAELRAADAAAAAEKDALTSQLAEALQEHAARAQESTAAHEAVDAARGSHAAVADRVAEARARRERARALADAAEESSRLAAAAAAAEADRDARLVRSPFADAAEASAALLASAAQDALADGIHAHDVALSRERERLLLLETDLAGVPDEPVDLAEASAAAAAARAAWNDAVATAARDREVATQLADAAARAADVHAASAEGLRDYEVIAGLANAVAGRTDSRMDLETFVLAAELEEIVAMANLRLDAMSDGRYRLQHTDAVGARRVASGLGLVVLDAYTGQTRQPQSLSGGETFLASLALALGLAQVVTQRAGGVRLDTLFIDEGFGSLDAETLDLAMRTLDELRQGGRTVGLISHVEAMKEQLPARLHVEATPQGPSVIRQDAGARV